MRGNTATHTLVDDPYSTAMRPEVNNSEPDPYAGLNRAQRRKAQSVERKAAKHGRI